MDDSAGFVLREGGATGVMDFYSPRGINVLGYRAPRD